MRYRFRQYDEVGELAEDQREECEKVLRSCFEFCSLTIRRRLDRFIENNRRIISFRIKTNLIVVTKENYEK